MRLVCERFVTVVPIRPPVAIATNLKQSQLETGTATADPSLALRMTIWVGYFKRKPIRGKWGVGRIVNGD